MKKVKALSVTIIILAIICSFSVNVFAALPTWDFYEKFPSKAQGENGFYILWGPKLDNMKESNCYPSEDEPSGSPQQWKGGTQFSTISQSFMMPGEGVIGTKWVVPEGGSYDITFKWEFSQSAKSQINESNQSGFDGFEMGILDSTNTKLYSKTATLTDFKDNKTLSVKLKKDDSLLIYMDKIGNQSFDMADTELIIKQTASDTPASSSISKATSSSSSVSSSVSSTSSVSSSSSMVSSSSSKITNISSSAATDSNGGNNAGFIILIVIAVLIVAAGVVFFIIRNKKAV